MFISYYFVILVLCASHSLQQKPTNEQYYEELYVNPLNNGFVNTYFQFTTKWHYGSRLNLHHTRLTPRPIAEILLHYDVKEFHISLTHGFWRYDTWGYPVIDSAPGAEVWAWFSAPNLTNFEVDKQWIHLTSVFSGILCASLNFIDKTNTVEPKYGFRPQFSTDNAAPRFVRYASLPREIVCTENLTPWKKLMPCSREHGFGSLLNSGYVHNTNYHSLALKVRTFCDHTNEDCILEFTQTANLVYDPKLLGSNNDFSLRRMFGQGLNGHCILSESSKIYVNTDKPRYVLTSAPTEYITSKRGGVTTVYGVYDMKKKVDEKLFNIAWVDENKKQNIQIHPTPPITAHRFILGRGQEHGKIITQIKNSHYSALPIVFQEHIPWYVPSYMHTLKLLATKETNKSNSWEIIPKLVHFQPGVQRTSPYHLEIAFELPPKSTVEVSFDFDYIFLKWLEYPPDANHGHYLGAAVISTQLPMAYNYSSVPIEGSIFADSFNASRPSYFLEIRTESLILSLPTPDFSMPYNVICLACTVVALAFGPIHSVATKRIIIEPTDAPPQSFIGKTFHKLFRKKQVASENMDTNEDTQNEIHEKTE